MDERGLVYEYNADSASCHTEAGLILEKWAEQGYTGKGHNPAEEGLSNELAGARKHSRASFRPCIAGMMMARRDYHAQFMRQALHQADFASRKFSTRAGQVAWDDAGRVDR